MCEKAHFRIVKYRNLQVKNGEYYTIKQITNIIKHYAELYSVVQLAAINYEKNQSSFLNNNREVIL